MRKTPLLVAFVCVLSASAAWSDTDQEWTNSLNSAATGALGNVGKTKAAAVANPGEIPGAGEGRRCLPYGQHTQAIPTFDPLGAGCMVDPLDSADAVKAAWDVVKARLDAQGKVVYDDGEELQKGLGQGQLDFRKLDEDNHWGDLAYLYLKRKDNAVIPTTAFFVTYRAHKVVGYGSPYIGAERYDFQCDSEGKLISVVERDALKFDKDIMWGPDLQVKADLNNMSGFWVIRWHQLLKAWAEAAAAVPLTAAAGTPSK